MSIGYMPRELNLNSELLSSMYWNSIGIYITDGFFRQRTWGQERHFFSFANSEAANKFCSLHQQFMQVFIWIFSCADPGARFLSTSEKLDLWATQAFQIHRRFAKELIPRRYHEYFGRGPNLRYSSEIHLYTSTWELKETSEPFKFKYHSNLTKGT